MLVTEVFSKSGGNLILKRKTRTRSSPHWFLRDVGRQLGELSLPCILFFFAFLAGFAADFFLAIADEGAREGPAGLVGAGANKVQKL